MIYNDYVKFGRLSSLLYTNTNTNTNTILQCKFEPWCLITYILSHRDIKCFSSGLIVTIEWLQQGLELVAFLVMCRL
jgi:hypothetical protein